MAHAINPKTLAYYKRDFVKLTSAEVQTMEAYADEGYTVNEYFRLPYLSTEERAFAARFVEDGWGEAPLSVFTEPHDPEELKEVLRGFR